MKMLDSIRKFGLGFCDLPTMLGNVSFMLRALTLNIDPRNKNRISPLFYILTALAAASYFYVYLISMAWFVSRCTSAGDVLPALIVFSLGVSSEIGVFKLFYMFLHIGKIQNLVSECLASDALVPPCGRFSTNLLATLRSVKKRAMLFWVVLISNGVVYILKPILLPGRHLMEDIFIIYGLEPMYESPNYEIAFLLMATGVCVTVYLPANITAFLILITGYIEAQMLAWSQELNHLWQDANNHATTLQPDNINHLWQDTNNHATALQPDNINHRWQDDNNHATALQPDNINHVWHDANNHAAALQPGNINHRWQDANNHATALQPDNSMSTFHENNNKKKKKNEYVRRRLVDIIKGHSTNINLLRQIESIFRGAIAVEFSLLIVGLIAELLGGLENTYMEIPFALMQVSMDCWTGQRVMDASLIFERAVYECKWENFDKNNMKTILLMLQNSQKTMTLSAGGITMLSLSSLMAVIKNVYSAYTTLRTTMK